MDFVANPDKQTSQKSRKKSRLSSKIQWIEYETLTFFEENQSASRFSTNKRQEAFSNAFFNHGSHPPLQSEPRFLRPSLDFGNVVPKPSENNTVIMPTQRLLRCC